MAVKDAAVRLDLKPSGFQRGIRTATDTVKRGAKDMGGALRSGITRGVQGGLTAVQGLFSTIKDGFRLIGGLAAGVGFGSLIKGATDSQRAFQQLANRISIGTGRAVQWRDLQSRVQASALRTKVDVDELGGAFQVAFQETGDLEAATRSLDIVGNIARVTGAEMDNLGKLSGILTQKFGITSVEMGDAMAQLVASANAGGVSIQDLADDFAEVGGKAKTLGLEGPAGIRQMVGVLNLAKRETGNFSQAMTALPQIFDQIIERGGPGGDLAVKYRIETVGPDGKPKDPVTIISDIIEKTRGEEAKLGELGFGGEGLQTLLALARPFREELETTGGDIQAAREALDFQIQEAAGTVGNYNDILDKAQEKLPADQINDAVNKLKIAFTRPELINAVTKLAEQLPMLAEGLAKLINFIVENPLTAGGLAVGGTFARGAIGGILGGGGAAGGALGVAGAGQAGEAFTGTAFAGAGGAGTAFASTAFAGGAVAAAGEQFGKLMGEIGAEDILDVPDKLAKAFDDAASDFDRIAQEEIRNAFEQGRVATEQEQILGVETGRRFRLGEGRDPETGQLVVTRERIADQDAQAGLAAFAQALAAQATGRGRPGPMGGNLTLDPVTVTPQGAFQGGQRVDTAEAAAANARALASQLRATQLKTRIDNTAELATAIGNSIPKPDPAPGRGER